MEKTRRHLSGLGFALLAAVINGSVGVFITLSARMALESSAIAFYKCFLAVVILAIFLWANATLRQSIRNVFRSPILAAAGFFGVFVMNSFEVRAYRLESVATVVLMFLAGATVATQGLTIFMLSQRMTVGRAIAIGLCSAGVFLLMPKYLSFSAAAGCLLGAIAGVGYGTYMVIAQRFALKARLEDIFGMMVWGTIFLLPEYIVGGARIPSFDAWGMLIWLAMFPTILGYFLTTAAVTRIGASKVQLLELSEPLFAALMAWYFLNELLSSGQIMGGLAIVLASYAGDVIDKLVPGTHRQRRPSWRGSR
ncbi:DMT family transporter [Pinirhizobacter sp.]|jgi:drug/metabolite transporter (DMT)-like permease|uniref:DMT family transporter n=1 Tax=Pinirhizobacter sp. TaxID=2950432 RepID=UPI002F3F9F8D